MALLDLTSSRASLDLINQLPAGLRTIAWAAANPPLAAEAALWQTEPRRAARFSVDTVVEALTYIDDETTLDALHEGDKRLNVQNAASSRSYELARLARQAESPVVPSLRTTQRGHGLRSESATIEALTSGDMADAARTLFAENYRLDQDVVKQWLTALTAEDFSALIAANHANSTPPVVEAMLQRGHMNEAFSQQVTAMTLCAALAPTLAIDADIAKRLLSRHIHPAGWRKLRWTDDGLNVFKDARQYDTLLSMRAIDMAGIIEHAQGLLINEVEELIAVQLSAVELELMQPEVLRLARAGHRLSPHVVEAYSTVPNLSPELRHLLLLNTDPRLLVKNLRQMAPDAQRSFVEEFSAFRPNDVPALFAAVGEEPETPGSTTLLWLLCEQMPNPLLSATRQRSWMAAAMVDRVTESLDETDWQTFFKLVHDFSGTLDELLATVKALR